MMIEMRVENLTVDPFTNMPLLMLREKGADDGETLPLPVGNQEALGIASELEAIAFDRPMAHDLMKTILEVGGMTVTHVEIHSLRRSTFYATITLQKPDATLVTLDARPSDAIAIALRTRAPIFVAKKVVDKARPQDMPSPNLPLVPDDVLQALADKAFGKWKM